jgi:hypothetical protein
MGISREEFDRKVEVVENALYRLKERDFLMTWEIQAIDNLLACNANCKVDLYDLIRFHEGPEKN